ncbi:hypothetical protein JK358_07550 [Nocardia sp. 2]|uniref:Mce-associated membrane protein n=1 Tax=Nocardia acididurans TaxID=2802282 RepID=A0ABS1M137_9NOCA|nr:hypothetical protein [Nocardia acididurans]MBL1074249.1 hypothetical protein [Nocardia acididurans]
MKVDLDKTDDAAENDSAGSESEPKTEHRKPGAAPAATRTIAVSVSTLAWSAALAVVTTLAIVLGVLLILARGDLSDRDRTAADIDRAEQVAGDYAVGAATVNYADFASWVGRLKANTAPALANKFDSTAPSLQQILDPLKWTSTASPISAKVESETNGVYQVNVFVNVTSTNAQNPEGGQTTVTYRVTVDRNADWKITDVGGMDGALPLK